MKNKLIFAVLLVFSLVLAACSPAAEATEEPAAPTAEATEEMAEPTEEMAEPTEEMVEEMNTIVDIAVADGRFTTLVAALEAAGLAETLAGEGAFTVFAPTDEAFAALPEGTVEALLADISTLTEILLYHVVDGVVLAETVVTLDSATTLQGSDVTITVEDGVVKINDATVIITDIVANNGVIHVIDMVILPPTDG